MSAKSIISSLAGLTVVKATLSPNWITSFGVTPVSDGEAVLLEFNNGLKIHIGSVIDFPGNDEYNAESGVSVELAGQRDDS